MFKLKINFNIVALRCNFINVSGLREIKELTPKSNDKKICSFSTKFIGEMIEVFYNLISGFKFKSQKYSCVM